MLEQRKVDRDDDKDIKVISLIFVFDLVVVFFEIVGVVLLMLGDDNRVTTTWVIYF